MKGVPVRDGKRSREAQKSASGYCRHHCESDVQRESLAEAASLIASLRFQPAHGSVGKTGNWVRTNIALNDASEESFECLVTCQHTNGGTVNWSGHEVLAWRCTATGRDYQATAALVPGAKVARANFCALPIPKEGEMYQFVLAERQN